MSMSSLRFLGQEMQIMKEYTQLTESLRYQFFVLNKSGMSQTKIALQLDAGITRHVKLNSLILVY